jgi:hypothetical protein
MKESPMPETVDLRRYISVSMSDTPDGFIDWLLIHAVSEIDEKNGGKGAAVYEVFGKEGEDEKRKLAQVSLVVNGVELPFHETMVAMHRHLEMMIEDRALELIKKRMDDTFYLLDRAVTAMRKTPVEFFKKFAPEHQWRDDED